MMLGEINYELLKPFINAFIIYEIATHGVDPRDTLEGTTLRVYSEEGYKYEVFNKNHNKLESTSSYVDLIIEALPGVNLVDYHMSTLEGILKDKREDLENTLRVLYERQEDSSSFEKVVSLIGGRFDILGFLFFLKDSTKYMPIRSESFDERFKLVGVSSQLAGNCTWNKYEQYNSWLLQIQAFLKTSVNKDITLIDAHSFVWILPGIEEYINKNVQVVEHKSFGKGTVIGFENDLIIVRFGKETKMFHKENAFKEGFLKIVPIDFDIYGFKDGEANQSNSDKTNTLLSPKGLEVAEALLKLVANRQRIVTYSDLSAMTESKPSAFYEMRIILEAISKHCEKLGLPFISAMVVNKNTGLPGNGFRELCISEFGYSASMTTEDIFEAELDKIGKCDNWEKLAKDLGLKMPKEIDDTIPEELQEPEDSIIVEGAKTQIIVNAYERDPKAKSKCKDFYMKKDGKIVCQICGFDFGKFYGPEYSNRIHIHHIIPISEIGEEYVVDPVKDLIPVCPNCHMILHLNGGISVGDLKNKIKK